MFSTPNSLAPSSAPLVRLPAPWHPDTTNLSGRLTGPSKGSTDPFTGPSLRPW